MNYFLKVPGTVVLAFLIMPVVGVAQVYPDSLPVDTFTTAEYQQARGQLSELLGQIRRDMNAAREQLPMDLRESANQAWPRVQKNFELAEQEISKLSQMSLQRSGLVGPELRFKIQVYLSRRRARPEGVSVGSWWCDKLLSFATSILQSAGVPGGEAVTEMAEAICAGLQTRADG